MRKLLSGFSISVCVLWAPLEMGCAHYVARPLNPPAIENQYRIRTLDNPELAAFIRSQPDKASANWPPAVLDSDSLTLVAYFYHPDLDVARAAAAAAEASVITARQRVNPSVSGDAGYSRNPESAITWAAAPAFTIETAGKRAYRTLQAEKLAEAARVTFIETGWQVRGSVRNAVVAYLFAQHRLDLLRTESAVRDDLVEIYDTRRAAGEAATPDLDVVRAEQSATRTAISQAAGEADAALAVLETACGLPPSSLAGKRIELASFETPPPENALPIKAIQRAGLLHRADIRRMLVEYAAADALLRLEIARQYPDIVLSPSWAFQEGFADYTLGVGLNALPILHRLQGPIAEAEAQRRQVEARFRALQSRAIGEMEEALRQYRAALSESKDADRFLQLQRDREAAARAAMNAGESDRLGADVARLLTIAANRTRLDALQRAQTALGALEDSMQHPLAANGEWTEPPLSSPRAEARP